MENHNKGERNGNAKLTAAEVKKIITRAGYDAKLGYRPGSIKELAERYGLSRTAVRHIARGDRWAHMHED